MAIVTHKRHIDDLETVLSIALTQPNTSGEDQAKNLTGKTVYFKMVDVRGNVVVAETDSGVTIVDTDDGYVSYDFSSGDVDVAGVYYGYFIVEDDVTGDRGTFPDDTGEIRIIIFSD